MRRTVSRDQAPTKTWSPSSSIAGTPAASGAMYGFGHTPQANETLNTLMSGVLDAMHEVAPQ